MRLIFDQFTQQLSPLIIEWNLNEFINSAQVLPLQIWVFWTVDGRKASLLFHNPLQMCSKLFEINLHRAEQPKGEALVYVTLQQF